MVIYKYPLDAPDGETTIIVPVDSKILSVQAQHDKPMLYIEEGNMSESKRVTVRAVMTGYYVDELNQMDYIGTLMLQKDDFVLHFYQIE